VLHDQFNSTNVITDTSGTPTQRKGPLALTISSTIAARMSEHKMTLQWERDGAEFSYQKYPRDHIWTFDGGHTMTATAAPGYLGNPANVDPEEAFVASLSSCYMLTFLAIA
jgi:organic hydroperoxide reductase OsmC/OhrA